MGEAKTKYEKVLFRYHSNVIDEDTVETMWAEILDSQNGIYKLDSIPFYGPMVATGDEFYAEFDPAEDMLTYRYTTTFSGNSIVLVIITERGFDKEIIRSQLKKLNCESEGLNDSYFSIEILRETDYSDIKKVLVKYEREGVLEYAEPCLSEKHQRDLDDEELK